MNEEQEPGLSDRIERVADTTICGTCGHKNDLKTQICRGCDRMANRGRLNVLNGNFRWDLTSEGGEALGNEIICSDMDAVKMKQELIRANNQARHGDLDG